MLWYRRIRYGYAFRKIPLTQHKFAVVDPDDYDRLSCWKWCAVRDSNTYYAVRSSGKTQIRMHRQITDAPSHLVCDHINHNGLDNRKANLRLCTKQQNIRNRRLHKKGTSRYKGVDWNKQQGKWRARIYCNSRCYYLGYFTAEVEAARAYDSAARKYHGQFAYLNLPTQW